MTKVVKFTQNDCPKCDILEQMLGAMEIQADETIMITDDNVEEIKETYSIMGTPTLIKFDAEGNETSRTSQVAFGAVQDFFN